MAFDSLGRYTASHKTWDHVGNLIPVVEYSEGVRPHGEFRPAAWLPTQFFDKYYEDYFVVMPGKILACDNDGHLVPAQYELANAQIEYLQRDVDSGVIDVRTGVTLLVADIGTFNVSAVTAFMGATGVTMTVSKPIGVAPYAYWQWAGDAGEFDDGVNPSGLRQHNYQLQHRCAILCDYVLELPLVPAIATTENLTEDTFAANVATFDAVANLPVAANTALRSLMVFANGTETDASTAFAVQKDTLAEVTSTGDWYIDLTTGVISHYAAESHGAGNLYTLTYSHYGSAPTGSNVSKFASALGDLKCGDFLIANADSNYVVATTEDFKDIIGQVLEVEDQLDKDALSKVRTAYPSLTTDAAGGLPAYAGQLDQMPGSSTGGVTDKIHYAGAANLVVRINLVSR